MRCATLKTALFVPVLFVALLLTSFSLASETEDEFTPLKMVKEGSVDGPTMARELIRTFLSETEWQKEVKEIKGKFQDWEKQSEGDMGQYLNDRFILMGLAAAGGKVDKIKKGMIWLAFYKEFNQPPPSMVVKFLNEHQGSLTRLFTEFRWEKASTYIKNKEWRADIEDRKKAELASSNLTVNTDD
jgi:hypothetical protein